MKIEVGKWYKRRDGAIVGPARDGSGIGRYPYLVGTNSYTNGGAYYIVLGEHELDLIEEVNPPTTKPTTAQIVIIAPNGQETHIGHDGALSHAQGHIATAYGDGKRIVIRVEEVVV